MQLVSLSWGNQQIDCDHYYLFHCGLGSTATHTDGEMDGTHTTKTSSR